MPIGSRHRLTGLLLRSPRGYELRMDDGGHFLLDLSGSVKALVGRRVTIEGARSGFDLIDVDRIERETRD